LTAQLREMLTDETIIANNYREHGIRIVTDLLKAFLGNVSVNTFQRATMEDVSQWTNVIARC
jgi:hypothetical protein